MDINGVGARADISEMLNKIRELSNKTPMFSETNKVKEGSGFDDIMAMAKNSVSQVDKAQTDAESLKTALVTGEGNVSMSQVIMASQKSKLAFEGLLAVRNKILESYKEIMSMPI